jgi:hypothetical protein
VEVFDSFEIAEEMLRKTYHILEVALWAGDKRGDCEGEEGEG